jgi:hypothetical protein
MADSGPSFSTYRPVRISGATSLLIGRAHQSERTFYRSLDDLESAGLIRRAGQLRLITSSCEGRFGRTYLHLTEHGAVLLGFENAALIVDCAASSAMDATAVDDPSFMGASASLAGGAYIKDLSPAASQKRQPGQVPADLERLRSLGFQKLLIFRLMREAKQSGKLLSDVVEAAWTSLRKAARPICYLRSLLSRPVDFGAQVRLRNAKLLAARDAVAVRDAAAALAHQVAGQRFVDLKGEQLLEVDAEGQGASITSVHEGIARRLPLTWAIAFGRACRDGQWRLADEGDARAFAGVQCTRHAPRTRVIEAPAGSAAAHHHLASLKAFLRCRRDKSATFPRLAA